MGVVEDWLFNKNVFELVVRVLLKVGDLVGRMEHGYTLELRAKALCMLVEFMKMDLRNKKPRMEGLLALQYIAVDECFELRVLLLKLGLSGSLHDPSFPILILKTDPNPLLSTLSSYYLKQYFC